MQPVQSLWNSILDAVAPVEAQVHAALSPRAWTSRLAEAALRKSRRPERRGVVDTISKALVWISQPERWWRGAVTAALLIFLPQLFMLFGPLRLFGETAFQQPSVGHFNIGTTLTTAWQVLAGIIGLTFVIVVFLIEFAHSRTHESRAFPLFAAHTGMIFIVIFGLLTLVSMGINAVLLDNPVIVQEGLASLTEYNLWLFVANMLLTAYLYTRTYRFVNPKFFRQIFLQHNREKVSQSVEAELRRRVAFQLLSRHCSKYGIEFSLWRPDHRPQTVGIKPGSLPRQVLEVTDVNIHLLHEASKRARAQTGGASNCGIVFTSYPRSRISAQRPEVAHVSTSVNRPQITELLRQSVRLSPLGARTGTAEDDDLQLSRDLISDAIRAGRAEVVEELLDQYLEVLEAFLAAIEAHDLQYTPETARQGDGFFQDWPVVTRVRRHYLSLAEQALQSHDRDILHHFVGFPLQVMSLAQNHHDHLIFQRFADLFPYLYATAKRVMSDTAQRGYVYDRCWRLLVEFYKYRIQPDLEDPEISEVEAGVLGDYSEFLIIVLNRLLKSALDLRDIEQFRHFAAAAKQIPQWIGYSPVDRVEDLQVELSWARDETVRRRLEEEIAAKRIIASQLARVQEARQISFMGLGGWLVHLLETGQMATTEFRDYVLSLTTEFTDIRKFYALYSRIVTDIDIGDPFGWDSWEMEERPESHGDVVFSSLHNSEWVGRYYLYRAIELSPSSPEAIPDLHPVRVSKQLADEVTKGLDAISISTIWRPLVVEPDPEDFQRRASALREMHQRAAKRQEVIEEDELIRQPLDDELVQAFVSNVEKHWRESATIRNWIKRYGRHEERPNDAVPEKLLAIGIKQLQPKAAFVKQDRVMYGNWGEHYGRELARGEDAILGAEFSALPTRGTGLADFDTALKEVLKELRAINLNPTIFYNGIQVHRAFYASATYEPLWRTQTPIPKILGVDGLFEGALVVRLSELQDNTVVVVDLERFAILTQYRPDDSGKFPLSISVREITSEVAEDLLERQPGLGRNPDTGEALDKEAAIRRLRQRVLVDIWGRYRFEEKNPEAGRRIQFTVSQLADDLTPKQ